MPFGYPPRGIARGAFQRLFGAPNFLRRLQWPTLARLLALQRGHTVLDIGCGDLQLTAELAKRDVAAVVAVDVAPRLQRLAYVARRLPRLRLVRAAGDRLPLADASVDRVLVSSVLQMVPNPAVLLAECRRVLRRGGRLVVTVPEAYCYLPRLFRRREAYERFLGGLNRLFGVRGAGYVGDAELVGLLQRAGFDPGEGGPTRVPGRIGTLVWETSLAASYRLGDSRLPMLLAFTLYPVVRVARALGWDRADRGCELLVAATVP